MSAAELAALLFFCTAMSFSPGPNTTLATTIAANHGLRHALRFCVAVPTGWTLLMLLCGSGLSAIVLGWPVLRWAITAIGVAYMLWLAWKIGTSAQSAPLHAARVQVSFLDGVGLQFLNIKGWMLALTLTAGWVVNASGEPASNPGERLAIICLLMIAFTFTSSLAYAAAGSLLRNLLAQGERLLWFNRTMALVLVATALWMLIV